MPKQPRKLSLSLIAISNSTKSPAYKLSVNGTELVEPVSVVELEPLKKNIVYEFEDHNIHTIKLELLNKEPNDTKVVDDKIVEDLLIIVDKIVVDSLNLTDNLRKMSVYKNDKEAFNTNGYITFNGTITIKIHKNLLYNNWVCSLFN
jgi:hypothetical protein